MVDVSCLASKFWVAETVLSSLWSSCSVFRFINQEMVAAACLGISCPVAVVARRLGVLYVILVDSLGLWLAVPVDQGFLAMVQLRRIKGWYVTFC